MGTPTEALFTRVELMSGDACRESLQGDKNRQLGRCCDTGCTASGRPESDLSHLAGCALGQVSLDESLKHYLHLSLYFVSM